VIGPRKIPIAVARPVASNEESIEKDDETSKTSNHSVSAPVSTVDEEVKFAESTVEDTSPAPKKDKEPEEQVQAQEEISVETVDEQDETTDEDNNINSTETVATKSESEDETWEEVSNN